MDSAPRDRMILIHCANAHANPLKVAKWVGDCWIHTITGLKIHYPTGWVSIPDWSMQPTYTPDTTKFKKSVFFDRDSSIYARRKAGETNQAIAMSHGITKGRASQIYHRMNKKVFDVT
jgi:hypothetical protein